MEVSTHYSVLRNNVNRIFVYMQGGYNYVRVQKVPTCYSTTNTLVCMPGLLGREMEDKLRLAGG